MSKKLVIVESPHKSKTIEKYLGKISGPLLDRIDIHIEVKSVKYQKLQQNQKLETSQMIRKRVNFARQIQNERYKKEKIFSEVCVFVF